ncbi:MAG: oligopeptide transporter, OPT family, partial [Bacteroidales bacterium]|nr:oligopeptide transporter, OPT family [Bacteroidales bacterium]
ADFLQIFLSSLFGGFLGILFLIPFRKYFVSDMHGKYPFPEATATTQVLISGQKKGNQAKVLLISGLIGGLYDFVIATFGAWSEVFTTRVFPIGAEIAEKAKVVFKINVGAAVLGLGYIVGLKYSALICAGSFLAWYVIVPLLSQYATIEMVDGVAVIKQTFAGMSAETLFRDYARLVGIGGIAMAGVIGIIRSSGIIRSAFGLAVRELSGKTVLKGEQKRTRRDLPMKIIFFGILATLIMILLFFYFGIVHNLSLALTGLAVVAVIAFLFTTVAANAIAIVGTNPVSGMTLMTLIIASLILVSAGLSGVSGMIAALLIGGVVCTALSMAGGLITDFKIGYWLGVSPYKQQTWKFLGTFVSAATVGGVMILLNKIYGFTGDTPLVAPQANAMAAVIKPMMSGGETPWILYGSGAALSLILTMIGVPALPFALGIFIPLELNTPLLVGGLISWYVTSRTQKEEINTARQDRGTLIASGLIAGGALMGVVSALMANFNLNFVNPEWTSSNLAQWTALIAYILLIIYFIRDTLRAKGE